MSLILRGLAAIERHWRLALALGLLLRLAAVFATPVFPLVANTWDSTFYHETATALADSGEYAFQEKATALYPPGYPALLSLAYRVFGPDPRVGQWLGVLASLVLMLAAAALARSLSGARAGRRTIGLLALDPTQIVLPAFLMSEVVCAAFLALGLWALAACVHGRRLAVLPAAVALTTAGMIRGHAFLVAPAVLGGLALAHRLLSRTAITVGTAILVVNVVALGLWSARTERVLGEPVLLATNGAMNLLLGNNANANGGRADPPGGVPQTGDELLDQRLSRERALEFMRRNPFRTLFLMPVKAVRLWVAAPVVTYRAELREKWGNAVAWIALGPAQVVHGLLWVGALVALRRRTPAGIVWVAALSAWTLGHLPFLGGARYLFPMWFLAHVATASLDSEAAPIHPIPRPQKSPE